MSKGFLSRFRSALVPALESKWFAEPWGLADGQTAFSLEVRRIGSKDYQEALKESGNGGGAGEAFQKIAGRVAVEEMLEAATGKSESKPGFRRAKKATNAQREKGADTYADKLRTALENEAPELMSAMIGRTDDPTAIVPALVLLVAGWRGEGLGEFDRDELAAELLSEQRDETGAVMMLPAELPNPYAGKWLKVDAGPISLLTDDEYAEAGTPVGYDYQAPTVPVPYGGQPLHLAMISWILDKAEEVEHQYHNGIGAAEGN